MDWLTFFSKLIDSLAWPTVALALGLVFRKKLLALIPAIRKFKAGPLEAEFELAAKEIRASAAEAASTKPPTTGDESRGEHNENRKEIVAQLLSARNDPAGMILVGWGKVTEELLRLGDQLGDIVGSPSTERKNYAKVMNSNLLPEETKRLIRELRELRNKVVHSTVMPTSDAAQDYVLAVDRVVELIHNYRKNLPNYASTNR